MASPHFQRSYPAKGLRTLALLLVAWVAPADLGSAQSLTRAESLKIAESFIQHRWQSSAKNVRHGKDSDGIEVHTPDRDGGHGNPLSECWVPNAENIGVAYKWGGNDSPEEFQRWNPGGEGGW